MPTVYVLSLLGFQMEFSRKNISIISLVLLLIASFIGISEEIAVMSIDIGSEWMKVAIVSVSKRFLVIVFHV